MRSWLAPPDDDLDRVRWAFLLANLATCLLAFGALASAQQSPAWLVATGVAGVAVLALCRAAQYRLGRLPASLDLLEGAALLSVARLEALGELGVGLAIDDFGVGYSSLEYLRRFPVQTVKIDKSFVQGVERGSEDAAFARGIIELGRVLGLEVVAEGIERRAQLDELRELGCDLGQGFLFARPCPGDEAGLLLGRELPDALGALTRP